MGNPGADRSRHRAARHRRQRVGWARQLAPRQYSGAQGRAGGRGDGQCRGARAGRPVRRDGGCEARRRSGDGGQAARCDHRRVRRQWSHRRRDPARGDPGDRRPAVRHGEGGRVQRPRLGAGAGRALRRRSGLLREAAHRICHRHAGEHQGGAAEMVVATCLCAHRRAGRARAL